MLLQKFEYIVFEKNLLEYSILKLNFKLKFLLNFYMLTFQNIIDNLQKYWRDKGCLQIQSYDMEMGAATFHPQTALKSLGDKE